MCRHDAIFIFAYMVTVTLTDTVIVTHYCQRAGTVALPGFMPQPWWSPPGPQIHRPNGLQVAVGQPAAMMHTQPGRPYSHPHPHPAPRGYRGM